MAQLPYQKDLEDVREALYELMADLEDIRDEAQELDEERNDPGVKKDIASMDQALKLLDEAAAALEVN